MKNLILKILSVFLGTIFLAKSEAGSLSGGGGNTLNAPKVTMQKVKGILLTGKPQIVAGFNMLEKNIRHFGPQEPVKSPDLIDKLFKKSPTIFEVLDKLSIDLIEDAPCKDKDGNEMDGAAPGSTPGSICISGYNATKKLSAYEARVQILALVAHEVSHLLDFNETEAEAVQLYFVEQLNEVSVNELAGPLGRARLTAFFYDFSFRTWVDGFDRCLGFECIKNQQEEMARHLQDLRSVDYLYSDRFPLLNALQDGLMHELLLRQHNWVYFVCLNTPQTDERLKFCQETQVNNFRKARADRTVSLPEFHQSVWFIDRPYLMDENARVLRIDTAEDLRQELKTTYDVFKQIHTALKNLGEPFALNLK